MLKRLDAVVIYKPFDDIDTILAAVAQAVARIV